MSADESGAADLVEFISRFIPLYNQGKEKTGKCCFCDDEGHSFRVGDTWRCFNCNSQEIHSGDKAGFYACWINAESRDEAIAKLGNGAGLPDAKPVEQRPLKRLPFWGWRDLEKQPTAAVWIHELSGAVLVWRQLLPERVHLGIIQATAGDWQNLGLVANRRCVLLPENNPESQTLMAGLAAALYRAGHKQVMCLALGLDERYGTRELPEPGDDVLKWAKARSKPYPKPNGEAPHEPPMGDAELQEALDEAVFPPEFTAAKVAEAKERVAQRRSQNAQEALGSIEEAGDSGVTPSPAVAQHSPAKGNGAGGPALTAITPEARTELYTEQAKAELLATMVHRRASTVTLRATDWLWPGKIPLGEICVIQGDPGLGKSQITASLAAIITTGGQWPLTREPCPVGSVIILSAEDSMAKTIVPRLAAAGADLERVTILQAMKYEHGTRGFSLLADLTALDALIGEEDNPMAVIVDPISAYQDTVGPGAKTHDSHKNVDVRSLLRPVSELVDRRNITVILINHLTKGTGRAITRGQGNMAFVAGPRAVWQVSKDKDDSRKRLFLPVKNNLADDSEGTGLSFGVEPVELGHDAQGKPISTSRIMWNDEKVTITADEAAGYDSLSQDERGSQAEAQDFLREALAECRLKAKDVERAAKDAGLNLTTLGRAKRSMGIISEKEGFGATTVWYWRLKD